ncbi:MAG: cell wall metabolism sensor histidine kinase WalK [Ruminococcaceae bacterium]|nr:cell wall metabolism sensor histidine kinase WalK [Oscillospiraceae bacterium]
MKKSLYFKIILILVLFVVTVIVFSGVILLNNVTSYYMLDFYNRMEELFDDNSKLKSDLSRAMENESYKSDLKHLLDSYSGVLGIDDYRNFYILDNTGRYIDGTDDELGQSLEKTPNLIAALSGKDGSKMQAGSEFADYATRITANERSVVIYIKDSMDEMQRFIWIIFSIVLQTMVLSLIFAIILSFFLSKAITSPIRNITESAKQLREGDFEHDIEIYSDDEIGMLSATFNEMKAALKSTLDVASDERAKLETVFTYLRDAVIAFTEDGRVLHINKSAIELFGDAYTPSFNVNSFISLLNTETDSPASDKSKPQIDPLIESDIMYNGRVLDINFGNIKYNENNKTHDGLIAVIHDITGRYELERSRREFVANVSHEMRTPLTSIRGACETMLQDENMPEDFRRVFLNMALTECDRMTNIVSDLLTLSRLDNKKTRWKISTYNIADSLKHVTDVIRVDAQKHKHKLTLSVVPPMPEISADRERIEQVLINILSNSVKYTPDGGQVSVQASKRDENTIEIVIADNGIGIPKEDVKRIFERFYRVEKSRTSETGGTGLGLAIAKEIVNAHAGDIVIDSELEKGTKVTISLPIKTPLKSSDD